MTPILVPRPRRAVLDKGVSEILHLGYIGVGALVKHFTLGETMRCCYFIL